jgi:hypothetical protein
MKKGTLLIWVIIFGIMALFIFQNQDFFLAKKAHTLNLGIKQYAVPEMYNAILVLAFFFAGLIISYLFSLSARFKAKRTIKKQNLTIASHLNQLAELKSEINTLKGIEEPVDELAKTTKLDISTSKIIDGQDADKNSVEKTVKFDADDTVANPGADDTGESLIKEKE